MIGAHWLLAVLVFHLSWLGPLVKGNLVLLIKDGIIQWRGMRRGSISKHDLAEKNRLNGKLTDPSKVRLSYLERDGDISVLPKKHQPSILDVSVNNGVQTIRIELE